MKTKIFTLSLIAAVGFTAKAQDTDSVSLGAGYANESYYSFDNGEAANVDNGNWDLAFDLGAYGVTIRFNRRIDVLYLYPGDTSNWSTLDTTGIGAWEQYIDGYGSWFQGAFNMPADAGNPSDVGWGIYNTFNHQTVGDRLFVVELENGSYRKLWIELLAGGVYTFRYANLDNSNEQNVQITKGDYSGQNFIHYSLLNEQVVDREPLSDEWDIVFTNYVLELAPDYFGGVTGVLSNSNVEVLEVSGVPTADADYNGTYVATTNEIGYNWKSFNMGSFQYDIIDSLTYFVLTTNGDIWKLVFTGFNGSSDGKIYFSKQLMTSAGIGETSVNSFNVYPNPASQQINLLSSIELADYDLYALNGQLIRHQELNGAHSKSIDIAELENGVYLLLARDANGTVFQEKVVVKR